MSLLALSLSLLRTRYLTTLTNAIIKSASRNRPATIIMAIVRNAPQIRGTRSTGGAVWRPMHGRKTARNRSRKKRHSRIGFRVRGDLLVQIKAIGLMNEDAGLFESILAQQVPSAACHKIHKFRYHQHGYGLIHSQRQEATGGRLPSSSEGVLQKACRHAQNRQLHQTCVSTEEKLEILIGAGMVEQRAGGAVPYHSPGCIHRLWFHSLRRHATLCIPEVEPATMKGVTIIESLSQPSICIHLKFFL